MSKLLYVKYATILAIIAAALYFLVPRDDQGKLKNLHLGLDLQGGVHLLLGVASDEAVTNHLARQVDEILAEARDNKIYTLGARQSGPRQEITFAAPREREKFKEYIAREYPALLYTDLDDRHGAIALDVKEAARIKDKAVDQALEIIRNRVDALGVAEPTLQRQGKEQILIQLPGMADPERAKKLIGRTAVLEFKMVDESVSVADALAGKLPPTDEVLYEKVVDKVTGRILDRKPYVLIRRVVLTGDLLTDAQVNIDQRYNEPYVSMQFSTLGARKFATLTTENVGKRMAIILDGNVYSAPVIRERIGGGRAQITGSYTMAEAQDLSIVLRAGALPAKVTPLEERTVGPSMGADSIAAGELSMAVGFGLVVIFMAIYYRFFGLVADLAVFLNLVLVLGGMAAFGATLTMPGIAGMVLTVGMAVDANVLIYERIREELRLGKSAASALEAGYAKAFTAIFDSNLTTLIAALVLFQFGTGSVKGFAVTLSLGTVASMFTAIFCTRALFEGLLGAREMKTLSI
ncbi:MAG: protein translocase subunit SecD [Nitrospirae bacterium CG18_big_fil_WC_8_21_14_2_50_70_55]|nr:protein translocase subunit SecD [Deltaproteobacteria bacterium]OIP63284.1 MAG: protein-export membrane protein SecD [Nitrospirae bacterium CG2_30_70_394]PIQ06650.1 MAG: protein translocase subunit SecD [Nitrospirae bacterium CG18_big_fil_WC_8_21_14_2_50_70_55]PIU78432.1 MAG: protein translocase subunit SecD [Nitrospirae bacterium CG06_land_8_20_14_3_00_70_43]PIW84045.1 MAG: protein translocase subunit SecD [Nitrospirae bacterium CG_4_8_14_3_um_filter_70_85]PIX84176.1 MAG: protein transloca